MIGQTPSSPHDDPEAPPLPTAESGLGGDGPKEVGGRGGLDPVRYGDWEKNGRCIDF